MGRKVLLAIGAWIMAAGLSAAPAAEDSAPWRIEKVATSDRAQPDGDAASANTAAILNSHPRKLDWMRWFVFIVISS